MSIDVIVDTNFIISPFQLSIDVFGELETILNRKVNLLIPSPVLEELSKMASSRSDRLRNLSRLALGLAKRCQVIEVKPPPAGTVDDTIVRKAKELGCIVATNDRELIRRLKMEGIPRVFLRQKRRIVVEGAIP